ncbi:MAG: hypothetical protein GWN71_31390, partial [Gammaproteobacteria bacterium]|nr:hypothetical protein [Gemmatimonadota bacterium]NIU77896.1 hypothetical protein [Gammaproteobacteria bacterium]
VLIRARWLTPAEEDDLVTLLWEQEFTAFQYGYVDVLAEGLVLPAGEQRFDPVSPERLAEEAASAGGPGAAEAGGAGSAASAPPAFTPDD